MTSPVTREVVLDVTLPEPRATGRVEVRQIRMQPHTVAGPHVHNGPVFGNIVAGSVVYQIEGQAPGTLRPGDGFHEPEGARIARFDATAEGVTFLGYFLLAPGEQPEMTIVEA